MIRSPAFFASACSLQPGSGKRARAVAQIRLCEPEDTPTASVAVRSASDDEGKMTMEPLLRRDDDETERLSEGCATLWPFVLGKAIQKKKKKRIVKTPPPHRPKNPTENAPTAAFPPPPPTALSSGRCAAAILGFVRQATVCIAVACVPARAQIAYQLARGAVYSFRTPSTQLPLPQQSKALVAHHNQALSEWGEGGQGVGAATEQGLHDRALVLRKRQGQGRTGKKNLPLRATCGTISPLSPPALS